MRKREGIGRVAARATSIYEQHATQEHRYVLDQVKNRDPIAYRGQQTGAIGSKK